MKTASWILALALFSGSSARAQVAPVSGSSIRTEFRHHEPRSQIVAREIKPEAPIRLRMTGGETLIGTFAGVHDSQIRMGGSQPRIVPVGDVGEVWKRGRASHKGAMIGMIALGSAGALLGSALGSWCQMDCQPRPEHATLKGGVLGVFIGGGVGLATGALIGSAFPAWNKLNW